MGCDIHLKLERRRKLEKKIIISEPQYDESGNEIKKELSYTLNNKEWHSCNIINSENTWSNRVYGMFSKLADVRNYWSLKPIENRGFPDDASLYTLRCYALEIIPDARYNDDWEVNNSTERHFINESSLDEYMEGCHCSIIERKDSLGGTERYVTNPDYHSPNWCTVKEMEESINEVFGETEDDGFSSYVEWQVLLNIMKTYEEDGKFEVRAVYWFDS